MFTGIVEAVGTVGEVKLTVGGLRLRVETPLAAAIKPADSIAVHGVCLTVIHCDAGEFHADIGPETARITNLGELQPGDRVNLERPLALSDRLGGHFVLGHVDGVGIVDQVRSEGDSYWLTTAFPPPLSGLFIRKGSVAVNGVSLTVAGLSDVHFDVQVIPYTWQQTTLGTVAVGDKVNLECDMIGKYVVRALELSEIVRKPV
jgi:riboflavin synthase